MKTRKSFVLLSVALAICWASSSFAQVAPAPRLWLGFNGNLNDGGTSTVSPAHSVYSYNYTGGSYNGVFTNDVAKATCGTSSLYLPGDASFVGVANASDLNFNTDQPFTVSAWIKTTTNGVIWAKSPGSVPSTATHTIECYVNAGTLGHGGNQDNTVGTVTIDAWYSTFGWTSRKTVNDGSWHNVVCVCDGVGNWAIYIDGVLDSSGSPGAGAANEGANGDAGTWNFAVGATFNTIYPNEGVAGDPFTGNIDEVAVWDNALSPNQIASTYSNGIPFQTIDITQEPVGTNLFSGQTATLKVVGAPVNIAGALNYQWQSNGVPILGATSASYTTPPLTPSANGAVYDCQLTVGSVTVLSANAVVEVHAPALPPPAVLWLPFNNSLADIGISANGHVASGQSNPGYDGFLTNDVANVTCGTHSLYLPGDGSFVQVTNASDLNFNTGQPFTVSAWIKTTLNGVIWAKSPVIVPSSATHTIACYVNAGTLEHGGNQDNTVGTVTIDVWYSTFGWTSRKTVNDGSWHNVVCVCNGVGNWAIYIDGVLDSSGSPGAGAANEGANSDAGTWNFAVGATFNTIWPNEGVAGDPFTGNIDEVAYWPSVLTAEQVVSIYLNGIPTASINITQQPANTTVLPGQTATFQVAATLVGVTGTINYQWQSNGVSIVGATSATYTTPPLTASADGAVYHCNLSVGALQLVSADAVVGVITPALPPTPVLWLPFNGDLTDHGTSTNVHYVSGESIGPLIAVAADPIALIETNMSYDGTFTTDVANASCGSNSLSLRADGSYILVTNVSDLNFDTGHPFTISAWINLRGLSSGFICGKSPMTPDISITPSMGALSMGAFGDVNPTHGQVNVGVFYVDEGETVQTVTNGWSHVAVTYDGANNWVMYVNGFQDTTYTGGACNEAANVGTTGPWPFFIGYAGNTTYPLPLSASGPYGLDYTTYYGEIDEVAVWNTALTKGQIYSVYSQGVRSTPLALSISKSGNEVTLSWAGTGYVLQQNSSLTNPSGWSDVPGGGTNHVTVTIGAGSLFFRLREQ